MNRRTLKLWLLAAIAALLLAALAAAPLALQAGSTPPTPAQAVQQAWQRAHDLGTYRFTTDLTATAYPAPTLANTGRPARDERLHLEGDVDLPASTLQMSLWGGDGSVLNPASGVEVRIEGDVGHAWLCPR
jgi:ABC-type amino acid transport substrate-binding protein